MVSAGEAYAAGDRRAADPSNLTPGNYQATLTITAPLANPVNSTVQLRCKWGPAPTHAGGGRDRPCHSRSRGIRLLRGCRSCGIERRSGSLAFSATAQTATGGQWLSVNTGSGPADPANAGERRSDRDPTGLATGTYTGTVTISSSTTGASIGFR